MRLGSTPLNHAPAVIWGSKNTGIDSHQSPEARSQHHENLMAFHPLPKDAPDTHKHTDSDRTRDRLPLSDLRLLWTCCRLPALPALFIYFVHISTFDICNQEDCDDIRNVNCFYLKPVYQCTIDIDIRYLCCVLTDSEHITLGWPLIRFVMRSYRYLRFRCIQTCWIRCWHQKFNFRKKIVCEGQSKFWKLLTFSRRKKYVFDYFICIFGVYALREVKFVSHLPPKYWQLTP